MALIVPFSLPAGSVSPFAGLVEPQGWLFMYGQEVYRNDYPALFDAIGETYGAGDSEYTFNLPDARGRAFFGRDNMGGVAANRMTFAGGLNGTSLGAAGGGESVTLTVEQMPSHSHSVNAGGNASGAPTRVGISQNYGGAHNTTGAGSSSAHSNIPPALIVNYIIKT